MASTRTNLTAAFVAGLVVVAGALGLTFWMVRNASVYNDVARYASTEADLAASLILEAGEGAQPVVIGPNKAAEALSITVRLGAMLNTFPGYLAVVDPRGVPLFQTTEVKRLSGADSAAFKDLLTTLTANGPAALLSLDSAGERLLLVARNLTRSTESLGKLSSAFPRLLQRHFRANTRSLFSFSLRSSS